MSRHTLDLGKYRAQGSRVFAGRETGAKVRNEAGVASFEISNDELEVLVPEDTFVVSSSFILALFGATIRKLGENEFRRRVVWRGKPVDDGVSQAISEALRAGDEADLQ